MADIDQAKGGEGGERKENQEQYRHQERGGSQAESTNPLSDSILNHNSPGECQYIPPFMEPSLSRSHPDCLITTFFQ